MVASNSLMNNFSGGLKTEFTGLNFPENAATDTENVVFSIIGEAVRREGIDLEVNAVQNSIYQPGVAYNTYRWTNVGGDGLTQVLVTQVGNTLYFFTSSAATAASPLSSQLLASTVTISAFQASGNTSTVSQTECQFTDGNGYLFVFHPDCDPFYCTYNAGTVTSNLITVQIRDFNGIPDGLAVNNRPATLSAEHQYNLQNQGWTSGSPWTATNSQDVVVGLTTFPWIVASGIVGIVEGQIVAFESYAKGSLEVPGSAAPYGQGQVTAYGTVISYTGSTLTISAYNNTVSNPAGSVPADGPPYYTLTPVSSGYINTWLTAEGNYPSDADQWWVFKDDTGDFNPATTVPQITLNAGQAPQGYYILNAWSLNRSNASGITGLTTISTNVRPRTGCWFQGRVWYAGVDSSQTATGDEPFYTWSESIYFSQIITPGDISDFGSCYQTNDPTSEDLNAILPSDGGVIVIQGCGAVYNLFPVQNGLLVFAANGVWIIRGNEGLGFTADDYSINKISSTQSVSGTSIVNVQGYPVFWNEEGIYYVQPSQDQSPYGFGGFKVEPMTVGTILSYYNNIPRDSKRFVRGDYNPITYIVEWTFRSTQESGIADRYQFDTILNFNTYTRAFYPYTIATDNSDWFVSGIKYVSYPEGTLDPSFKYLATSSSEVSFAEELDDVNWVDWFSVDNVGVDYLSYFITGYNLDGKGIGKFNNNYITVFCDNSVPYAYNINAIWDYAGSGNSGRWSNIQTITNFSPNYNRMYRRHKLRGQGMSMQIQVSSVTGQPFAIDGWSMFSDVRRNP